MGSEQSLQERSLQTMRRRLWDNASMGTWTQYTDDDLATLYDPTLHDPRYAIQLDVKQIGILEGIKL